MRSPTAAEISSKASAKAARVAGGKPAKHGTDSTSDRSTTARSYCGVRTRATEGSISSPAVHLAVTFDACSGSDGCEAQSERHAHAGWAVHTRTSALVHAASSAG